MSLPTRPNHSTPPRTPARRMPATPSDSGSPTFTFKLSPSALKPNLSRRNAILRLQSNGVALLFYLLVWVYPRYYRMLKSAWTMPLSLALGLDWVLWLNATAEGSLLLLLFYNGLEAAYCLWSPPPPSTAPKMPISPSSPKPIAPAPPAPHRRLLGSPKSPLPTSLSSPSFPTSSLYQPYRSQPSGLLSPSYRPGGSSSTPNFHESPTKSMFAGPSKLATSTSSADLDRSQSLYSSLGSSVSSSGSYLEEIRRRHSQTGGRALDSSVLQRLVTELEFD